MKIICLLQNSWGGRCSMIFKPNPNNKSAKILQEVCGTNIMHFCNTTLASAKQANQRLPYDPAHVSSLLLRLPSYDLILACGKQALAAYSQHKAQFKALNKPIVFMQHPASRSLTKIERNMTKVTIDHTTTGFSETHISAAELTEIRHNLIKYNREEIKAFKRRYQKIRAKNNLRQNNSSS